MVLVPLHKDFPIVQTTQPTRMAIAKAKKNGHVDVVKLLIEKKSISINTKEDPDFYSSSWCVLQQKGGRIASPFLSTTSRLA